MKRAYQVDTSEVVFSKNLPSIMDGKQRDDILFQCPCEICRVKVIPCSYEVSNIPSPYFKIGSEAHVSNCFEKFRAEIEESGRKNKLSIDELEVVSPPLELVLACESSSKVIHSISDELNYITVKHNTNYIDSIFDNKCLRQNRVVYSIEGIVDFYLASPCNRDEKIKILGHEIEYRYLFKRISIWNGKVSFIDDKLFYAPLLLTDGSALIEDNESMIFNIYVPNVCKTIRYKVVLPKEGISENKLGRIRSNYRNAFDNTFRKFQSGKLDFKYGAYIFFIGKAPTNNEPYEFNVVHSFIYFQYTDIPRTINK